MVVIIISLTDRHFLILWFRCPDEFENYKSSDYFENDCTTGPKCNLFIGTGLFYQGVDWYV